MAPAGASFVAGVGPTGQSVYISLLLGPASVFTKSYQNAGVCAGVRSSGPAMPPVTTPSTLPGIGHPAKTLPLATPGARQGFPQVTAAITSLTRLWHAPPGFKITSRQKWLVYYVAWGSSI